MKEDSVTFNHKKVAKIYIVYEINKSFNISDYLTVENWLFGAVTVTKNVDIKIYKYFGYVIGFDGHGSFSFPGNGLWKNVIIFGVDMSSSTNIDNRKKDILILVKDQTQGLEHMLRAEKLCSINLTENNKKFCLSLYYNGENSYLFVMVKKFINSMQKILRLSQVQKTGQ